MSGKRITETVLTVEEIAADPEKAREVMCDMAEQIDLLTMERDNLRKEIEAYEDIDDRAYEGRL